jgi:hypothetical protein
MMKKQIVLYFSVILTVFALVSCGPWPVIRHEVVWEGEGGGTILFAYRPGWNYDVVYQFESETYHLVGISFDAGEKLVVREIPPDENHLVLLVANSRRYQYPHGTRLWVFDLSVLPDGDEFDPLLDIIDPEVLDATIDNDKVEYRTPDGWLEYKF